MHILMITDVYFPRVNGVSTSIQTFRDTLHKQGHKVTLIAPGYGEQKDEKDIIRIKSKTVPFDREDRLMGYSDVLDTFAQLKDSDVDVIHIQTPFVAHYAGVKLAKMLDVPVVLSYHTFFEEYLYHYVPFAPKSLMKYLARRLTRSQCNEANIIISPSHAMADVLQKYGVTQPINVLPTGLDLCKFEGGNRIAFRQSLELDSDQPTLLFIGRVAHEKNIEFLLHVVKALADKHPDLVLIIAGEGPAERHLKQLVNKYELDEHVVFIGYLNRDTELLDCYRAGDIFVFASQTETQGLVLIEAMAMGLPVVAISEMGTSSILDARQGALVAEHDVNDFANKVSALIDNRELRRSLGMQGKQYADSWSIERCCSDLIDLYTKTISAYKSNGVEIQITSLQES